MALEPEWDDLLDRSWNQSIFLTWDWMYTWWEVYRDESKELLVITVRGENGKLLCIAPLIKNRYAWKKFLTIRQIRFLGTGENEEDEVCSEYLDFIVDKSLNPELLVRPVIGWIMDQGDWDELYLEQVKNGSCLDILIGSDLEKGMLVTVRKMGDSYYLPLTTSWEEQLGKMSSNQRYRVRKTLKELQKEGDIELLAAKNREEIDAAYDVLVTLHQKNWIRKGKTGVFESSQFNRFHRKLIEKLNQKNRLFLATLILNGTPLGATYNLVYKNTMLVYQTGIDSEISRSNNKIKPGMATHALAIQSAIARNIAEYDFLIGDQNEYKSQWTTESRSIYKMRFARKNARNYLVHYLKKTRSAISEAMNGKTIPKDIIVKQGH